MKTFKFLAQILLISIPLLLVSCSDDDDFKIPTPENSNILLSAYKTTYNSDGDYSGVTFIYDSKNDLEEAYIYNVSVATNDTSFYQKYVFGQKIANEKVVKRYYPVYGSSPVVWNEESNPATLIYDNKGRIVEVEKHSGNWDVDITWEGDRILKAYVKDFDMVADSARYHKGNYVDFPAYEYEWTTGDGYSKTTTTFSSYANFHQMIPVEYYIITWMPGSSASFGAYFSDNAVSRTVSTQEYNHYENATKEKLEQTVEYTTTTDYTLTFGELSKRVPEKVKMTSTTVNKTTDHVNPSNSNDNRNTSEQTMTFTYVKK